MNRTRMTDSGGAILMNVFLIIGAVVVVGWIFASSGEDNDEAEAAFEEELRHNYFEAQIRAIDCDYDADDYEWECRATVGVDQIRVAYECERDGFFGCTESKIECNLDD